MLENLIKQAQDLVASLNKELDEARKRNAEANQMAASSRIEKNRLSTLEIDIKKREEALEQGERPVKAAEEARRIQSENAALSMKLNEERSEFEDKKREFGKYEAQQRQELNKRLEEADRLREELKALRDEFKEKVAKAKEIALEEIKNKIGG